MFTTKTNIHHSKLPTLAAVGYLVGRRNRFGEPEYLTGRKQKVIVEAFPMTDSPDIRFSLGIHTAFFRNLATGKTIRASGFYFEGK